MPENFERHLSMRHASLMICSLSHANVALNCGLIDTGELGHVTPIKARPSNMAPTAFRPDYVIVKRSVRGRVPGGRPKIAIERVRTTEPADTTVTGRVGNAAAVLIPTINQLCHGIVGKGCPINFRLFD